MLHVLSEGRRKPGANWGLIVALGLAVVLWLVTVATYWIVGR